MDPNQPANSGESLPPRKEPHLPISMAETHPEIYNDKNSASSKNTFLTLASLLVLAGIVGITLWLYIQNKTAKVVSKPTVNNNLAAATPSPVQVEENNNLKDVKEINGIKVEGATNQALVEKYGAVCKRFTSIDEALKEEEVACILDLSGQNINSLPNSITKLANLKQIILNKNNFTKFPELLFSIKTLSSIDLSGNKLSALPEINSESLSRINIQNNQFSDSQISLLKKKYPQIVFE